MLIDAKQVYLYAKVKGEPYLALAEMTEHGPDGYDIRPTRLFDCTTGRYLDIDLKKMALGEIEIVAIRDNFSSALEEYKRYNSSGFIYASECMYKDVIGEITEIIKNVSPFSKPLEIYEERSNE